MEMKEKQKKELARFVVTITGIAFVMFANLSLLRAGVLLLFLVNWLDWDN